MIFEFPTLEDARGWGESDDYAPLKALRQATATFNMVSRRAWTSAP